MKLNLTHSRESGGFAASGGDGDLSRRRFLMVAGFAGVTAAQIPLKGEALAGASSAPWVWRGVLFGADASITLHGLSESRSSRLTRECFRRLRRLESLFSLHQPESALCRLNRDGVLENPRPEFVELLSRSLTFSRRTNGIFDMTVQPLWDCFHRYYRDHPAADSPPEQLIERARSRIGHDRVRVSRSRIAFDLPGMAITLNGIAQGFITDQITEFLRGQGVKRTLVNLGEYRALGRHPDDRPWQLGVRGPESDGEVMDVLPLDDAALAVSSGSGFAFGRQKRWHHLLHPRGGAPQPSRRTVAVRAGTATEADALATACAVVDDATARSFARGEGISLRIY